MSNFEVDSDLPPNELEIYETVKLVKLCSRNYTNKDLRKLAEIFIGYAAMRQLEYTEDLYSIFHLNKRMNRIYSLLTCGDNAEALPIERKVADLFRKRFKKSFASSFAKRL